LYEAVPARALAARPEEIRQKAEEQPKLKKLTIGMKVFAIQGL
jgi:hypothetical protein